MKNIKAALLSHYDCGLLDDVVDVCNFINSSDDEITTEALIVGLEKTR